jgi:hypothetical protein
MGRKLTRNQRAWTLVAAASGAIAALASNQLLRRGWSAWRKEPPPENPASPDVSWRDALIWAGATGLVVGVGRMIAKRGAAAGWRKVTGEEPPV